MTPYPSIQSSLSQNTQIATGYESATTQGGEAGHGDKSAVKHYQNKFMKTERSREIVEESCSCIFISSTNSDQIISMNTSNVTKLKSYSILSASSLLSASSKKNTKHLKIK